MRVVGLCYPEPSWFWLASWFLLLGRGHGVGQFLVVSERSVTGRALGSGAGDVCLLHWIWEFRCLDESESLILAQNERWRRA